MPVFELVVAVAALLLLVLTHRAWRRQVQLDYETYLLELARWKRRADKRT